MSGSGVALIDVCFGEVDSSILSVLAEENSSVILPPPRVDCTAPFLECDVVVLPISFGGVTRGLLDSLGESDCLDFDSFM